MSQAQIDYIMDTFDFHSVQRTMELLDWTWYNDGDFAVPDLFEVRQKARELLKEVLQRGPVVVSGGFEAAYRYGVLTLKFVLEEADGVD